ncbi:hypothetical protein FRZ67_11090 [Panacibacter ginsenosidivorans]|uniref:Glycosyltransferase family 1 protein n=1 Tax=Panacibacter ginsenosidivorans TaxID=1813871 RepID=A0A5B8V9J6_9BACT|nr:hypothetical protein [Panacibacter ginsenosidivorans]QEC67815.1 hypothetical protein FRZ67_11090 [Panacibacter ginsenosidivorans]
MHKPLNATLFLSTDVLHLNQVYVGFGILRQLGLINVAIKKGEDTGFGTPFFKCIIENKKIIFEMHDSPGYIAKEAYNWCDYYFKRSVTPVIKINNPKIIPWGLNFYITSVHDFSLKRSLLKPGFKNAVSTYVRSNIFLSNIFKIKNGASSANIKYFNAKPFHTTKPVIVFSPRLWDPQRVEGHKYEERIRLNAERIAFVKGLREHFSNYYNGGVEDTAYARTVCPELIIPLKQTHKKKYLQDLKQSAIGVSTGGLVNSIGWKFGEYIMFSKAIISNNINDFLLHAPVQEQTNYFAYESTDHFLSLTDLLIKKDALRYEMMQANYTYAQNYLRPEKQLAIALANAGFELRV